MGTAAREPLRLVIFDATDTRAARRMRQAAERERGSDRANGTAGLSPGLSPIWRAGAFLHCVARAADARLGASSWVEALEWAVATSRDRGRKIGSIQVWGHGGWGWMQIDRTRLDEDALRRDHPLTPTIDALRGCLAGPEALFWLRCCSAFGHTEGRSFAPALADRLGCKVAGHTYIIGAVQSGTHSLRPGERPGWDPREGVRFEGDVAKGALWSAVNAPNTVSFLNVDLPDGI